MVLQEEYVKLVSMSICTNMYAINRYVDFESISAICSR